jgi:tRNA (guanine37-N1)-methyltransferase
MTFRVLTLFPEQFNSLTQTSIIGKAVSKGLITVETVQIRDYSTDRHRKVDDAPFGGGAGMVMSVQPLRDALHAKERLENSRVIYLSPKGQTLSHDKVVELANYGALILVCGHYEGVDQRFIDLYVDEEISIGDFVLTGGELAAMVVIDSVSRMVGEVLKNDASSKEESFSDGLLEYPHYTRPVEIDGMSVPDVLMSGHHAEIAKWRYEQSLEITKARRPDLFKKYVEKSHDKKTMKILKNHL